MGWLTLRSHLKELFASKVESGSDSNRERKMSSSSTGSMKNKWLKAFKSLKTSAPSNGTANKESEKKNGKDREGAFQVSGLDTTAHTFQEYTYKKITPCDVCLQVLRGHTRQGLKCRICKLNVHVDCQEKVGRCQPKSRLLRRQKSTSEIETRIQEPIPDEEKPQEIDLIYQVLKQAGEISSSRGGATRASTPAPPATATSSNQHNTTILGSVSMKQPEQPNGTGPTAPSAGSFHRRSGPTQQQPLLLRGATSSLTVGPVPHASISGGVNPLTLRTSNSAIGLNKDSEATTSPSATTGLYCTVSSLLDPSLREITLPKRIKAKIMSENIIDAKVNTTHLSG